MSTATPDVRKCGGCHRDVVATLQGIYHVGGGDLIQKCRDCGWSGSQQGGFAKCPSCGNSPALQNDHYAS